MEDTNFTNFIKLVELDKEINRIENQINLLKKENVSFLKSIEEINEKVNSSKNQLDSLKKEANILELESKTLDRDEVAKKKKLDLTKSPKEYFSLEQELKAIENRKSDVDDELFNLWQKIEEAEKNYGTVLSEFEKEKKSIEHEIEENKNRIFNFNAHLKDFQEDRDKALKNVDEELLEQYNVMLNSVKNPVVSASDESCSACFGTIPVSNVRKLKQKKLVKCKDCYRLLYLKAETLDDSP